MQGTLDWLWWGEPARLLVIFLSTLSSDLYTPATYQLTEEGTFRVVDEKAMEKVSVLFLGSGEGVGSWGVGTKSLGR